jgi:folate-dependent phosphoribosylglycinamide formyltransferase PurN
MQEPLIAIIDASGTQVNISNDAYIAIASKDTAAINKAQAQQYDLRRQTSTASAELQEHNRELTKLIEQCNIDLHR